MNNLTIIIPAYNEAENIPIFLPKVIDLAIENSFSIIVINDGSKDNTAQILKGFEHVSHLKVINNKVNRGYGGSLKIGILNSETEYSIFVDADGQHRLEDVLLLFDKIRETDADMVVGSRKGQSENWFRALGKSIIRSLARFLMEVPIYDINSGMKIFRTELGKKYLHLYTDTMAFSDIICLVFLSNRHLVKEEPIIILPRRVGVSTIGVKTAFQTVMEILNIIILFNPLKVFIPLSLFSLIAGIFLGVRFYINNNGISIGSSMMLMVSLLIFLLGLIAEQLSNIRKEGKVQWRVYD